MKQQSSPERWRNNQPNATNNSDQKTSPWADGTGRIILEAYIDHTPG